MEAGRRLPRGLRSGVVRRVSGAGRGAVDRAGSYPDVVPAAFDPAAYCRQARRVRASFGHDLGRMHRELGELAGRSSAEGAPERDGGLFCGTGARSFGEFVLQVLRDSGEPVLRYSQRLALLEEAERRGVNRFQANLIIASVQHRLAIGAPTLGKARARRRWGGVVAYLIVQALLLWGLWQVIGT